MLFACASYDLDLTQYTRINVAHQAILLRPAIHTFNTREKVEITIITDKKYESLSKAKVA